MIEIIHKGDTVVCVNDDYNSLKKMLPEESPNKGEVDIVVNVAFNDSRTKRGQYIKLDRKGLEKSWWRSNSFKVIFSPQSILDKLYGEIKEGNFE